MNDHSELYATRDMLEIREILQAVRDLLEDESAWTKRAYARNERGHAVDSNSDAAVRWCLTGAVAKAVAKAAAQRDRRYRRYGVWNTRLALAEGIGGDGLQAWNDHDDRTHADVLELIDMALEKAA